LEIGGREVDSVRVRGIWGRTGEDGDVVKHRDTVPPRGVEGLPLEMNKVRIVRGVDSSKVRHTGRGNWRED